MRKRGQDFITETLPKQRKIDTYPPSLVSSSLSGAGSGIGENTGEKLATPVDKPGVVRVYDRRINTYCYDENTSLYSLLRAWVQDDPDKSPTETGSQSSNSSNRSIKFTETDYDALILYLESKLKEKRSFDPEIQIPVNCLDGISPADILSLHTIYYKRIKQIWKMLFTAKYGRYRQQPSSLCHQIPVIPQLERRLFHSVDEGNDEEYSLQQLNNELKKRKELLFPQPFTSVGEQECRTSS